MSHDKVVAFCEPNKCKVEVAPKTETDAFDARISALENGEFESVTADEFVGGVGNFSSLVISKTLSYSGYYTVTPGFGSASGTGDTFATVPIISSSIPFNGVVSARASGTSGSSQLYILTTTGMTIQALTTAQQEFAVTNGINVYVVSRSPVAQTLTIGIPVFV